MKKSLIALLVLPCLLIAQPSVSSKNNTSTLLTSGATWNGSIEAIDKDYNYLVIVIKANKSSTSNGLVVRWTNSNINPTYKSIDKRTYTANDTLNGANVFKFPIAGAYFKVSYTNTSSAQTGTFSLVTYMVKNTNEFTAFMPRVFVKDSLVNRDTVTYNFGYNYYKGYIAINNRSAAKSDSFAVEYYSNTKNAWTSLAIGLRDVLTDYLESSNSLIVIPISTMKMFEINFLRPGQIRIRNINQSARTVDVSFTGVN